MMFANIVVDKLEIYIISYKDNDCKTKTVHFGWQVVTSQTLS